LARGAVEEFADRFPESFKLMTLSTKKIASKEESVTHEEMESSICICPITVP
jgi:hypothetical protein